LEAGIIQNNKHKLQGQATNKTKRIFLIKNSEEGNMSYEVDTKIYAYSIDYGDRVVAAQYGSNPGN